MEKMCTMSNPFTVTFSIPEKQQVHTTSHLCGPPCSYVFLKPERNSEILFPAPVARGSPGLGSRAASRVSFSSGELEEAAVVLASWSLEFNY